MDEEVKDALEMMGKGYDHPSVEIEAPRIVIERHNRQMVEVEMPAFVKVSTGFKAELKDIDPTALKVWIYIALSINRTSETAYPGLRKIAAETNLSVNTVRDAVERLENSYNLLSVTHQGTKRTIYRVTDFVSANHKEPVSRTDTETQTVSVESQTVSVVSRKNAEPDLTRIKKQAPKKSTNINTNEPTPAIVTQRPDFKSLSPVDYRKVPELKIFMDATSWIPGSFVLETVYDFVHAGLTAEVIAVAFKEWTARGYKPANVKGYLEWARDGIPAAPGKAYAQKAQPARVPVVVEETELARRIRTGQHAPKPERTRNAAVN